MYFDAEEGLGLVLTPAGSFGQSGNGKSQGSSSPYIIPIQSRSKGVWVPPTLRKVSSRLTQGTAPGQPRGDVGLATRPGIALPPRPASEEPPVAAPQHYLSPVPRFPTIPFVGLEPGAGVPAPLPPPEIQPGPGPEEYSPEQPEDEPAPLAPREPQGWSPMSILLGVAVVGGIAYLAMRKPKGAPRTNPKSKVRRSRRGRRLESRDWDRKASGTRKGEYFLDLGHSVLIVKRSGHGQYKWEWFAHYMGGVRKLVRSTSGKAATLTNAKRSAERALRSFGVKFVS